MKSIAKICESFGDEVQHLYGNLFRVKRDRIKLAKSGLSVEDGELVYGNPRWFVNSDGKPEAKGIEKAKMDELRNSIQEEGLENPIRLRVSKNHLEVVNGERRVRCLELLCKNDSLCIDPASGDHKPASEAFVRKVAELLAVAEGLPMPVGPLPAPVHQ